MLARKQPSTFSSINLIFIFTALFLRVAKAIESHKKISKGEIQRQDKLRKFLEDDKKVLRFYCAWEEQISEHQTEMSHFVSVLLKHGFIDKTFV
jgi:hypothetical protein